MGATNGEDDVADLGVVPKRPDPLPDGRPEVTGFRDGSGPIARDNSYSSPIRGDYRGFHLGRSSLDYLLRSLTGTLEVFLEVTDGFEADS
jgi:hypothetical protein